MSLADLLAARKATLRPTETIVRPLPICCTGTEENGLACLGGEIEPERSEDEQITVGCAKQCAQALRCAEHAIVYTGAGLSTSTGISDYRGPNGVWTSLATGRIPDDTVDVTAALPSYAHMCISKLLQKGYLKFCTSTNLDALHYKSGLQPLSNLAELHGNMFCERCPQCETEVLRPFRIRRTQDRKTGRQCCCGGSFTDSGIDFGQALPVKHVSLAEEEARKSDFSLVVGTSMRVRPASELPLRGERVAVDGCDGDSEANLCIVNRMDTPFDQRARIRSYGDADLFFFHLLKELGLEPNVPQRSHLRTATEMKKLATRLLPPANGHYVGEEEQEKRMATALSHVEAQIIDGADIKASH